MQKAKTKVELIKLHLQLFQSHLKTEHWLCEKFCGYILKAHRIVSHLH